jgi:hypothetical protein
MDFRKHGISNKTYFEMDERIAKERQNRLHWNKVFAKIEDDPNHDEYSWQVNFERQFAAAASQQHVFKPPEIKFLPRASLNKVDPKRFEKYFDEMGITDPHTYRLRVVQMHEPSPADKELIYHGLSNEHEGRYKYLKKRWQYNPEVKYPFPMTSSQDYGWNMYDENNKLIKRNEYDEMFNQLGKLNPNVHALRNVVGNEFYRTNGALSIDNTKRAKFTR